MALLMEGRVFLWQLNVKINQILNKIIHIMLCVLAVYFHTSVYGMSSLIDQVINATNLSSEESQYIHNIHRSALTMRATACQRRKRARTKTAQNTSAVRIFK